MFQLLSFALYINYECVWKVEGGTAGQTPHLALWKFFPAIFNVREIAIISKLKGKLISLQSLPCPGQRAGSSATCREVTLLETRLAIASILPSDACLQIIDLDTDICAEPKPHLQCSEIR